MSALIVGREFLQEVEDMVITMLSDFEDRMVKAMIDNRSLAYGDLDLEPAERMLKFLDDEERGVNEAMRAVDEDELGRRQSQFTRDVERTGTI